MALCAPEHAIVRPPSPAYARCLRSDPHAVIDVERARRQHAAYVDALRDAGVTVEVASEAEAHPDATFVEDAAVILGACALVTIPGAPSRRGEGDSLAPLLGRRRELHWMQPPATLDGGDVLRADTRLLVGISGRTNRAGAEALAQLAEREGLQAVCVPVREGLHLKSACSVASDTTLLVNTHLIDLDVLQALALGMELLAVPEAHGANLLALGDRVLVSAAAPRTAELLDARGMKPCLIDVSELHKGDGALTCLSLRFAPAGAWSA